MRSLGTLGGATSQATGVHRGVVVGSSAVVPDIVHGNPAAFAIDVRSPEPKMMNVGGGGRFATATAISGPLVVGWSAAGVVAAIAMDLTTQTRYYLQPFAGDFSQPADVSGRIAVGMATTAAGSNVVHAAAWLIPRS